MTTKTFSPIQQLAVFTKRLIKPKARAITLVVMLLLMLSGGNWLLKPTQSKNAATAPTALEVPVLDAVAFTDSNSPVDGVTSSHSHILTSATAPNLKPPVWEHFGNSILSSAPDALDVTSQVVVNFDEPTLLTHSDVRDHYSDIKFSSDFGQSIYAEDLIVNSFGENVPRTLPHNILVDNHKANLYIDFPRPVSNLSFFVTGSDDLGTIFSVAVYQNNNFVGAQGYLGNNSHSPIFVNLTGVTDVTKVIVFNITDSLGVGYDDFTFTVNNPPPTPTPTPTPPPNSPPLAPTLLSATAGDQEVSLRWTAPQNATTYKVKQLSQGGFPVNGGTVSGLTATSYTVRNLTPNVPAFFAVSALNGNGESANSNTLSATPIHLCGAETFKPRPAPTLWDGAGWHLQSEVSDRDGLVIRNVTLNGRSMAVMMSLPYFEVKTDRLDSPKRGELTPDNANVSAPLRTRLVGYYAKRIESQPGHVAAINIKAQYAVDNISPGSKSCLFITQDYEFDEQSGPGQGCEAPFGLLPCSRFYPKTSYTFEGRDNEVLQWIRLPQRLHFKVLDNNGQGANGNTVGVFKDCDKFILINGVPVPSCVFAGSLTGFARKDNPVHWEFRREILALGRPLPSENPYNSFDNFHQSANREEIEEPIVNGSFAGCPDCVHIHWRWGTDIANFGELIGRGKFGRGAPIGLLPGSLQDAEVEVVVFKPTEVHPEPPQTAVTFELDVEALRSRFDRWDLSPADVVFWYTGTGYQPHDEFFNHGGFFNPNLGLNVSRETQSSGSGSQSAPATSLDGPTSVVFGYLYKDGAITFTVLNAAAVGPLPTGYSALNNTAYDVRTEAIFSGQETVSFKAASVNDATAFSNLRILHQEVDPFDPEGMLWADRTILSPDPDGPNFDARTIKARVTGLGKFVIASRAQGPTNTANLSITTSHTPEPVVAENDLTFTMVVHNSGPQPATNLGLINGLPQQFQIASVSSSQGTCKPAAGSVYCKLGTLPAGADATVSILGKPIEIDTRFPTEGMAIRSVVLVKAEESDSNEANNTAIESANALPNPNARPTVSIKSPTQGTLFVGPANFTIIAEASDSDGSVARVDFFDGDALIGTGTQTSIANQYRFDWNNVGFGPHDIRAVVTDNGSKTAPSNSVTILVNGSASVSINNPTPDSVIVPGSNLVINATASNPGGSITKVTFITDGMVIGEGTFNGNQYSVTWANVPRGKYVLSAIATDNSGVQTISPPVNVTVTNRPAVSISQPMEGTSYPSGPNIMINANVVGSVISKVEFYADGVLLGSGVAASNDSFTTTWHNPPDGIHSLTAVATDDLGLRTSSTAVNISVNAGSVTVSGDFVWFDDALPAGAVKHADGDVDWYWVDSNPAALSGTKAHQSRDFAQPNSPLTSFHQHFFDGATSKLPVNAGDKLFTYVFLDLNNMPREIMLQWNDGNNWEHRAYWGENRIGFGTDGQNSRRQMGPLPRAGQWVRLEVPAELVGLENTNVGGMAFSLDAGRATWDLAGKTTANAPPQPTPSDFVWVEDAVPSGSILETVDDQWVWLEPHFSGQLGHRSFFSVNAGGGKFRAHSFRNATATMSVQPGDVLFTYVFLDGSNNGRNMPEELVLQWYDGSGWGHRAFWGLDYLDPGTLGTETNRFMGGIPPGDRWVRLEVPASYVGLEGKTVSGMSYGFYDTTDHAGINWDYSGKNPRATTVPLPLSPTTAIWQYANGNSGVVYNTSDFGGAPVRRFYAYPNQAAATVPFYRFKKIGSSPEEFYSQCEHCYDAAWVKTGIACYVYPNASTPGTVPLYLYHDNQTHYFLTTDQNEANSQHFDAIWAYVYGPNPPVPAAPSDLTYSNLYLFWHDNSANESGFKIETLAGETGLWTQIGTAEANATLIKVGSLPRRYRVRAYNEFGNSGYSNEISSFNWIVFNTYPLVSVTSPANGDVVERDVTIDANIFDLEGAGTIVKAEFFADGTKLGELTSPPYTFVWNNAGPGNHVLTAKATDTEGAATTSSAVNITVSGIPSVFADDFNDNSLDPNKWTVTDVNSPALVTEESQQLRITLRPNTAAYNGVVSSDVYDLTGRMVQVEVAQPVSQAGWCENFMQVALDPKNYYLIDVGGNSLVFRSMVNGVNDQLVIAYDPAAFPYWRIRHNEKKSTVSFETSSDGVNWTTRKVVKEGFSLQKVSFYLYAGAWGTGNSNPGAAKYDNFQLRDSP